MPVPSKIRTSQVDPYTGGGGDGHYRSSKTMTIIGSPNVEDIVMFSSESDLMLTELVAVIKGTNPGVTIHPYYTANLDGGLKTYLMEEPLVVVNAGTGNKVVTFVNAQIPMNYFLVMSFTAVNPGSINHFFSITFKFTA